MDSKHRGRGPTLSERFGGYGLVALELILILAMVALIFSWASERHSGHEAVGIVVVGVLLGAPVFLVTVLWAAAVVMALHPRSQLSLMTLVISASGLMLSFVGALLMLKPLSDASVQEVGEYAVAGAVKGMILSIPAILVVVLFAAVSRFLRPKSYVPLVALVISVVVLLLVEGIQVFTLLSLWSLQTQGQAALD